MTSTRELSELLGHTSVTMAGAEPYVLSGAGPTVVLLHGWGGSPDGMRFLARDLNAAGCTVIVPLLAGSGTKVENLASVSAIDWIGQVATIVEHLLPRGRVSVAGCSLGGLLSLAYAALHKNGVASVAAVNCGIRFENPSFVEGLLSDNAGSSAGFDAVGPMTLDVDATEVGYAPEVPPAVSFIEVLGLMKLIEELSCNITVPVQLQHSVRDTVYPFSNADLLRGLMRSPSVEVVELRNSLHAAQIDFDATVIARNLLDFLRSTQSD